MRLKPTFYSLMLAGIAAGGLSACDHSSVGESRNLGITEPTPTPTATTTPSPTPTPTATATPTPSPSPTGGQLYSGPAELAKYINKFVDDGKAQGVDVVPHMSNPKLVVQIASLKTVGSSTIGLCESGGGLRRVTFDTTFWNSTSETQREILVHHELGHCVLGRPHTSAKLSNGYAASIMTPIILGSSPYLNNLAYYQQELYANRVWTKVLAASDEPHVDICDITDLPSEDPSPSDLPSDEPADPAAGANASE